MVLFRPESHILARNLLIGRYGSFLLVPYLHWVWISLDLALRKHHMCIAIEISMLKSVTTMSPI